MWVVVLRAAAVAMVVGGGSASATDPVNHHSNSGVPLNRNTTASPGAWSPTPWVASTASQVLCEEARIRCALRTGCGMALQNYMLGCADLMSGRIDYCDEYCKNSLIALTSTEEGHSLMDCKCSDDFCQEAKGRVEVCREEVVVANSDTSVVSCSVAHWICSADTLCATAIGYYDRFCRRMFLGKGCSYRCNNSISILQRQRAAAKLQTCTCDGSEAFDCHGIKRNMARLCFYQHDERHLQEEEEELTNRVDTASASKARLNSATGLRCDGSVAVAYVLIWAILRWETSNR